MAATVTEGYEIFPGKGNLVTPEILKWFAYATTVHFDLLEMEPVTMSERKDCVNPYCYQSIAQKTGFS